MTSTLPIPRLLDPTVYPHPTQNIRVVETHISWVILTGPFAYKLKKPVRLGFVHYSTLEQRRRSCEGEVRVSSRFAPDLAMTVVRITGSVDEPRVGGEGEAIEWGVRLVQFDENDQLDRRCGQNRLAPADCRALGEAIAAIEERLPRALPSAQFGTAESVLEAAAVNLATLRDGFPDLAGRVHRLEQALQARLTRAAPTLVARKAAGRVRECHGDLHLANIVLHDGRMTPFDAIEFSDNLRWIDVANDIAFLTMDLESRGRSDLAAQVVSSWVEAADDHAALAVIPTYELYRAIVRASIAAIRNGEDSAPARAEALRYLDLADRLALRDQPVMVATCGVSGSGKSIVSGELVGAIRGIRIRSDVERKRLAGLRPMERPHDTRPSAAIYDDASSRRVYGRLRDLAGGILDSGWSVVVDAACGQRWQRSMLAEVAASRGVPIVWVRFELPAETVLARVAARQSRGDDPSDATVEVVRRQLETFEPIGADERADAVVRVTAADDPDRIVARVAKEAARVAPTGPSASGQV